VNRYSLAVSDALVDASVPTTNRLSPALLRVFGGQKATIQMQLKGSLGSVDARSSTQALSKDLSLGQAIDVPSGTHRGVGR